MINTVVFDIGNVLAHFGWKEYLQSCGYEDEIFQRISKATVLNKLWFEWDRGLQEREKLIELCCQQDPGVEIQIREFFGNIHKFIIEYDYSEDFVKQLKENGYKVYILSNYSKASYEHDSKSFKFIKHIDGAIISYRINHVKPEPEIYKALIDTYQINPEEAVFLDDLQPNLEGAKAFGFQTVLMQSYDQAREDFRKLGIRI